MAVYYVDDQTGNDANDGLDNIGVGLATATWTEATLTLTQAGHGYTFATGDVIYISAGTGVTVGRFEVASSTANTIVLVGNSIIPDVGNAVNFATEDQSAGDITSSDGPWITIDKVMVGLGNGDHAWVRATASYTETVVLDTFKAAWSTPVIFEGYTTTPGDGGKVTIDGGATRASGFTTTQVGGTNYVFKNFIITNHTAAGVSFDAIDRITWKNCEFIANGTTSGPGILSGVLHLFENCKFNDNTLDGVACQSGAIFVGCEFMRNTLEAIDAAGACVALYCTFFSNGSNALSGGAANDVYTIMANCTVDGDGKDTLIGLTLNSAFRSVGAVVNCIFYDCVTGINFANEEAFISRNNLLNANTANYDNGAGTYSGEVLTAPDFVNEVAGADYSLNAGSPAETAGYDAHSVNGTAISADIGALQRIDSAGGGGLLMPNKRGGKQ